MKKKLALNLLEIALQLQHRSNFVQENHILVKVLRNIQMELKPHSNIDDD